MNSSKFLVILGFILIFGACESLAEKASELAADRTNTGITQKDFSRLFDKAQKAGSIQIIARLNMPFVPDSELSAQAAANQQARIAGLQDQLCAALSKYNIKNIKRFKYTPYIAMEMDATALKALMSNPLVSSIEEDASVPPTTQWIGHPVHPQSFFTTNLKKIFPSQQFRRVKC